MVNRGTERAPRRKRILIVNTYFPEAREPIRRANEVPDALAPVLLGGYFCSEHCDVKLYNEVNSGFLEVFEPGLLDWPDMVVLTGLTAAFDRLLHLSAHARTANPGVVVVAGGHGVRSLPLHAKRFVDYACEGDVEEIREVIRAALGEQYVARVFNPRYDLAYWMKWFGYVESSRNCNFRCGFCSLTGTGRGYQVNAPDYLEAQLKAVGKRPILFFEDNQLLGDGQKTFQDRIAQVNRRREQGQFKHWSGFVTDTFFWDESNIRFAHETGCISLFVGVESFLDKDWLGQVNKRQNARHDQVELIRRCLDGGVLFQYGLVFDPTERRVEEMYAEMDVICSTPEIPLPNFIFTAIPFPGTPVFHERVRKGQLLPNTRMRDLESSTLCLRTLDPAERVVDFITSGKNFRGYRRRAIAHQRDFMRRYRQSLSFDQKLASNLSTMAMLFPRAFSSPTALLRRKRARTHISTTDVLDCVYEPRRHVDPRWRSYFEPTMLTDAGGAINPELQDDALAQRYRRGEAMKVVVPA